MRGGEWLKFAVKHGWGVGLMVGHADKGRGLYPGPERVGICCLEWLLQ